MERLVRHDPVRQGTAKRGKVRSGRQGALAKRGWISMKKSEWKISGLYPVSADTAVDVINGCQDGNGYISARAVVDVSRPNHAVLHGCFEWNDNAAAEKWREQQARVMIKNIVTVEIADDSKREITKTFVHVISDSKSKGYKLSEIAIRNEVDRDYILSTAKRELMVFQEKYHQLTELAAVMTAIAETLKSNT